MFGDGRHPHVRKHTDTPTNRFQQHKGGPGDVSEPGPRTFEQADPHYSNTWPDPQTTLPADELLPHSRPMTDAERKHLAEDLHRDIPSLIDKDAANKARMEAHKASLNKAVPTASLAGMAAGTPEREPIAPQPAEQTPQQTLERTEHFKAVRVSQQKTDDELVPTSKATRGMQ